MRFCQKRNVVGKCTYCHCIEQRILLTIIVRRYSFNLIFKNVHQQNIDIYIEKFELPYKRASPRKLFHSKYS